MRKEHIADSDVNKVLDLDMNLVGQKVTFSILVLVVIVFLMYQFGVIHTIPCSNNFFEGILRSFIHINIRHFVANIAGFYLLYRSEVELGPKKFSVVILSILFLSVLFEMMVSMFMKTNCSIGFSGVLFGVAAWELFSDGNVELFGLLTIIAFMTIPSLKDPKVSWLGHLAGFAAGTVVALTLGPVLTKEKHVQK